MNENLKIAMSKSVRETATILGISERYLHELLAQGEIVHYRSGKRILITTDSIVAYRFRQEKITSEKLKRAKDLFNSRFSCLVSSNFVWCNS